MNPFQRHGSPEPSELRHFQIPAPSRALKERVLATSRSAWATEDKEPDPVPWSAPILHLATCIAIGWAVGVGADVLGKRGYTEWSAHENYPTAVIHQTDSDVPIVESPRWSGPPTTFSAKYAARRFSERQNAISAFLQDSVPTRDPS